MLLVRGSVDATTSGFLEASFMAPMHLLAGRFGNCHPSDYKQTKRGV
jgi:hypothetical protein